MEAQRPAAVSATASATASTNPTSTALAAPAFAGVRAPRENALRHGLTADTLIEQLVGQDAFQALVDVLGKELGACSTVEQGLVRRAAHHLAALDLAARAELAAVREGIRRHEAFGAPAIPPGALLPDGGMPDGGMPDGGLPDGGLLDGGLLDAPLCSTPHSARRSRAMCSTGCCDTAAVTSAGC